MPGVWALGDISSPYQLKHVANHEAKTVAHNIALIRGLSLFHGLGCAILLGASRKRFIGALGDAPDATRRGPGTIAVTLAAIAQGVQIHRVHDIDKTRQALRLWQAVTVGDFS